MMMTVNLPVLWVLGTEVAEFSASNVKVSLMSVGVLMRHLFPLLEKALAEVLLSKTKKAELESTL